jgi:hypothetical protein
MTAERPPIGTVMKRVLVPSPHGEYKSAAAELYYFSKRRWLRVFADNGFEVEEVEKVVKMAGVKTRHMAAETECSSDLCVAAAQDDSGAPRAGGCPIPTAPCLYSRAFITPAESVLGRTERGIRRARSWSSGANPGIAAW